MSFLQKIKDLYGMIGQGQLLDAFEKYYAENVVMTEIGEEPRVGKDLNRVYEKKFLASVEAFHGMGIDAFTANEDEGITAVENWMDLTFTGGARVMYRQVAVQKWSGDQIVEERFYHK